jgi:predicted porin
MNRRACLIIVVATCAAAAQAQTVAPYSMAELPPAKTVQLDWKALDGTVSLGLINKEREADGPLLEYVDSEVEHSVHNFMVDTKPRTAARTFTDVSMDRRHRAWGMSLGFSAGPVAFRVAHQNKHVTTGAPYMALGNIVDAKNSIIAANINMGRAKLYAAYAVNRGWGSSPLWNPDNPYSAALTAVPSTDSRDLMTGVAVPVGRTTWLASFIRKNDRDRANRDADQWAFGASHALSRHTDFYAGYSYTAIRSGTGLSAGAGLTPGSGFSSVNFGMRHSF